MLTAVPGVAGVGTYRGGDLAGPEGPTCLAGLGLHPRGRAAFAFKEGGGDGIWAAFDEGGAAIVSESFAWRRGLRAGDELTLPTRAGPRAFPVAGVFYDYASDQGFVMVSRATLAAWVDAPGVSSFGLFLGAEGAGGEELAPLGAADDCTLRERRADDAHADAVAVGSNRALREATFVVFDRTFAVTDVLRALATGVAFVGVLSALLALQLERAREIAVLRAQGVTPGEVGRLVLAQTGLLGAIAGALAIPLGLALSLVLILVVNRRSFGWTLEIELAPGVLLSAFLLAVGAALLAGLAPAWRMARTSPAAALRGD